MKKFYLFLILVSIWQIGCGTETPDNNTNNSNNPVTENAPNTNGQNMNASTKSEEKTEVKDEEVPKFDDAEEALKQGSEYLNKIKTANAIVALKQATELNPDLPFAHFQLGVAYALQESEKESNVETNQPQEISTPKKKAKKAVKKNSIKSFENAVKSYRKFIRKNPKDATANYNLGRAYNKLGSEKDKDARKALERAVKLDGENSLYRTELAEVLMELAKYPEAIRQLNRALKIDEDNIRAEDLLVKAKAGKKRTDFKKEKK